MDNQKEKTLLDRLRIMEVVETEMEKQKNDAVLSLVTFLCGTSIWVLFIALWDKLGKPVGDKVMTIGVEMIAIFMLIFITKFTRLDIRKMGVTRKNWKSALRRSGIISVIIMASILWLERVFCQ